jgi:hypothetical protein
MAVRQYVKQNPSGGWDVLKEGHRRSPLPAQSRAQAVECARDLVRREGGGEVRVLNRMGKVVTSDLVGTGAR